MARTPLRRRILVMTLINALMLLSVVLILTWRAWESQLQLQRIVVVDTQAVEQLDHLVLAQKAFLQQWLAAGSSPDLVAEAARRYSLVSQILDVPALAQTDVAQVHSATDRLQGSVERAAQHWASWPEPERLAATASIVQQSDAIVRNVARNRDQARRDMAARLEAMAREGRRPMWTALGVAWIVAVFSIAGARLAQRKVVGPLEELSRAAHRISAGDYAARAPVAGDREIAELGIVFNRMASKIESTLDATETKARTDEMTGLPNFRAFGEQLRAEIERASRYEESFGLLIFDLDQFKKYNDAYGHLAGDDALRAASAAMRGTLRTVDFPARYGGEEFAAILPQVDADGMRVIAERVRAAVEALPPIEGRRTLTVSVGGALFPGDGKEPAELFRAADQRLYEAKERGRNRVVLPGEKALAASSK